jgi:hypothetical protein
MEDKKKTCHSLIHVFKLSKHNKGGQFSRSMKFSIIIAGLVAVAMSEKNVEPEDYLVTSAMPALTRDTVCPGQRQFCLSSQYKLHNIYHKTDYSREL